MTILQTILACIYCIIGTSIYFVSFITERNQNSLNRILFSIFWIFLIFEAPYLWIKENIIKYFNLKK